MAIPTLTGIDSALSGIEAAQVELDTTSNNIDNESTTGYSEEVVNLSESTPLTIPSATNADGASTQLGTGVDVGSVTRQRNTFLDAQYRAQNTQLGSYTQQATDLGDAQTLLNEPSTDAISGQLQTFWSDWNSVANDPSSLSAQQALVGDAGTLSQTINNVYSGLQQVQSEASAQYTSLTAAPSSGNSTGGELYQDATKIASLNTSITQALAAGQSPNTLEDERDSALDDLSTLGNITVTQQNDGSVTVNFGDASNPLVSGGTVDWPQTITSATGGELGALLDASSSTGTIGGYMSSLSSIASDLSSTVNGLSTGFFGSASGSQIIGNPAVSAGSVDTTNAGQVANLQGGTVDQTYDQLVTQVGDDVSSAQSSQTTSQAIVTAFSDQRDSVSGVSEEQEMANLISEQRGYQASAQTLSTLSSVLGTLISQVGGAGL